MVQKTKEARSKSLVRGLSAFVSLVCAGDLAGWWFHLPILTSLIPGYATMKPNTALCLALLSVSVAGSVAETRIWRLGGDLCAGLALMVSGASLAEYGTGTSFGIDQWLATVPMERFADPPGRMAVGTAVCLTLTGTALLLRDRVPRVSAGLLLTGLTASVAGLVGFLLQSGPLTDVVWFRSLAVHTATCLLVLQVAALASRPERQPFRALAQPRRRDGRRRNLLLAVLVLPVLLALPVVAGMQARLYDARFALALLVVVLMAVQTLVLWADSMALERVETRLREEEEESFRILQSIGDAVIVTDAEARVLRMNPLAEQLTGWVLTEAKNRLLTEVFSIYSEETGEAVENPVDKVKRFGAVVGLANHTLLRHRAGHTTHIDDSSAPIWGPRGELTGIVLVFRNVNERKRAEAQLRASDEKLRVALSAAQMGAWELDLENRGYECSAICKATYGRGPEESFGYEDLLASIDPDDLAALRAAGRAALEREGTYRAEYRVTWPDGSLHWIVSTGQVFRDESGKPVRMAGVTVDVTERHRATEALMQSEKLAAVGRLAASIAHEINNPLEAVTNLLFLVRTNAESVEVKEYIATAERELERVSVIANQTLRFHKQSTKPRAVLCEELVGGVLFVYQGKIVNSAVVVERRDRAGRPVICFDGEIRQVLSNLIGNAIDAMLPRGGRLLLRSRQGRDWRTGESGVTITVADTGSGMSERTATRIFEPFYTTKGMAGTGLGLWISQEIVGRHRGAIRVRSSQREGQSGTVFMVFLPFEVVGR